MAINLTLSKEQLQTLCDAAIKAAQKAGSRIEEVDRYNLQRSLKDSGSSEASQLVTELDIDSEKIIRHNLQKISHQLNIGFVGEESSNNTSGNERFGKPYFWCVDPLDGTLPFVEGRSGYAVSIALVAQSGEPLIGIVYDPAHQLLYHAIKGQSSYQDFTPFTKITNTSKSLVVYADTSFKTHTKYDLAITAIENSAQALNMDGGVKFVYGSGAVINACHVLKSNQACYLKLPKKAEGGGSIWDFAATACIALEADAWASNIYGQPLALNRKDSTFMNHEGVIFASNRQIAQCLMRSLIEVEVL